MFCDVHSSPLERCGKIKSVYFGGSITGFPIIETINSDITEYIATNVISITDGQFYTNKRLFSDSIRPAIDTGLSVSRIGSSAQCKLIKVISVGIKNELTNYRIQESLSWSNSKNNKQENYVSTTTQESPFMSRHRFLPSIAGVGVYSMLHGFSRNFHCCFNDFTFLFDVRFVFLYLLRELFMSLGLIKL